MAARCRIMWRASARDTQYAANAHRAERNPKPRIRIDWNVANCCASAFLMDGNMRHTMWVALQRGTLQRNLPGGLQVRDTGDGLPQILLFRDPFIHLR